MAVLNDMPLYSCLSRVLCVLQVHCYYHGDVEDHEESLVALSTCSGLRGVILLGNQSYGLEPVKQSTNNEHLLYRLEHSQSEPFVCGVTNETSHTESHSPFDPSLSMTALLRVGFVFHYTQRSGT
uniref:Uncharacterized protein n=1 Tax=Hucho hucho TaxID=62062 RepID=A0A4W5NEP1_9TELE